MRHPAAGPPPRAEVAPPPQAPPSAPTDKPITIVDPPPVAPVAPELKRTPGAAKRAPTVRTAKDPALSNQQKTLDSLYRDSNDHPAPHELPQVRTAHAPTIAPQQAILSVVTANRRQLNTCYERVLKHDSSLKRARLMTHVKIGISGSVVAANISDAEYANSEIATCITQTIKHWHFPSQDSEYETEFPIILQAE
jgi:hypothetical protein